MILTERPLERVLLREMNRIMKGSARKSITHSPHLYNEGAGSAYALSKVLVLLFFGPVVMLSDRRERESVDSLL